MSSSTTPILEVNPCLLLALCDISEARAYLHLKSSDSIFISSIKGLAAVDGHHPCNLGQIYWFCNMLLDCKRDEPEKTIVVCAGAESENITACALLVGSFLILCERQPAALVAAAFRPIADLFAGYFDSSRQAAADLTVFECWEALHTVSLLGWLDFLDPDLDIDNCIDMQAWSTPLNQAWHSS
jgi:hypothetical protein